MKEEWKSVLDGYGAQFVMITGNVEMPELFVDNLVMGQVVREILPHNTILFIQTQPVSGAEAYTRAYFGQGTGAIVLDDVNCDSSGDMTTLLECGHRQLFTHNCNHEEDAGVRCRDDRRLKNVSATVTNTDVRISWELKDNVHDRPSFFEVECSNERHSTTTLENNQTFTTQLGGLLPSTPYNCCVSAVYVSLYAATTVTKACTPIEILSLPANDLKTSNSTNVNVIGGILGFIIITLLILLALSVTVLIYLIMRPRLNKGKTPSR